jgi:hypothetical protein
MPNAHQTTNSQQQWTIATNNTSIRGCIVQYYCCCVVLCSAMTYLGRLGNSPRCTCAGDICADIKRSGVMATDEEGPVFCRLWLAAAALGDGLFLLDDADGGVALPALLINAVNAFHRTGDELGDDDSPRSSRSSFPAVSVWL